MTEKELMQDEAIVKIAVAMKKMSVEYNVPVGEMISETSKYFDWLSKLPIVSTPIALRSIESAKKSIQNESERQCLDNLSEVLNSRPSITSESSKRIGAVRMSFMFASIGTLTID